MADPSWSNATRDDIHEDWGFALGLHTFAKTVEFFLHPQNAGFLLDTSDETAASFLTLPRFRITACKPGLDTDVNGWVYFKLTDENPGAGSALLEVYRGPNRDGSADDEKVASGSAANNNTITLAPETGYTFAATVPLLAPSANLNFRGQVLVPPIKRLLQLFDGTSQDDEQLRAGGEGILRRMRGGALTMKAAAADFAALVVRTKIRRQLVAVSDQAALIQPNPTQVLGVVTYRPVGLLEDTRAAQDANTGGSMEIKAAAGSFSGAVAYPAGGWAGEATTPSYGQRALASTITWRCTKGLGSTPPQFRATRKLTDRRRAPNEGKDDETLDRLLWIGEEFKAREWGINALTINYLASVANVTSALLSTSADDWSCTGLTDQNSTDGEVFFRYDGTTLKGYASDEGRDNGTATDVVCQATVGTEDDNTVFTFSPVNDSGLTIVGKTGAGSGGSPDLVTDSVGDVSFNPPSADDPVSQFTVTIAESTEVGAWGEALRDDGHGAGTGWEVNTGASPNIVDGQIVKALPLVNAAVNGDRT